MKTREDAIALLQGARVPLIQQEADLLTFLSATGWGQDIPPECFKFGPIRMILSSSSSSDIYRLSTAYEWEEGGAFIDAAQETYITRLLANGVSAAVISRHLKGMTERTMPVLFDLESGDFLVGEQEVPTYFTGETDEGAVDIVEDVMKYVNNKVQGLEIGVDGNYHHRIRNLANKQAIVDALNSGDAPGLFYLSTSEDSGGHFGVTGYDIKAAKADGRIPEVHLNYSGPSGMTCYGYVRVKIHVACHAPDSNLSSGFYDIFCFVPRPRRCGLRQIHLTVTTYLNNEMSRPAGQPSDLAGSGLPNGYVGEPLYTILDSVTLMLSAESLISEDPGSGGPSGAGRASMFMNHGRLHSYGYYTYAVKVATVTWAGWATWQLRQTALPTFGQTRNEVKGGFQVMLKSEIVNVCSRRMIQNYTVRAAGFVQGNWLEMTQSEALYAIGLLYQDGVAHSSGAATLGEIPGSLVSYGASGSRRKNIVVDNLMFCAAVDRPLIYVGNVWSMNRAIDRIRIKVSATNVEWTAAVRSGDLGDFTETAVNESEVTPEAEEKWRAMISQLRSQDGWFVGMGSVTPIVVAPNRLQATEIYATAQEAGINIETEVMIPKDIDAPDSFDITFRSANTRTNKQAEQGPYSSLVFADSMKAVELANTNAQGEPYIWMNALGKWQVYSNYDESASAEELQDEEDALYLWLAHGRLPTVTDNGFGAPQPNWDVVCQDIFGMTHASITVNPENLKRSKAEASEFTLMRDSWQYPVSSELKAGQVLLWGAARMQQFIAVAGSLITNPTGFGSFQIIRDGAVVYDPNKTMDDYYELTAQDIQDRQDAYDAANGGGEGGGLGPQ